MSESLNRAFIKAYDREKSNVAKRQMEAAKQKEQQELDLIMRFDTSSINVPQAHASPVKSHANSLVESASSQRYQSAHAPLATEERDHQQAAEATLRASIAAQMMQAGNWSDPRIDAFIGGFPSIAQVAPASAFAANTFAASAADAESPQSSRQAPRQPESEPVRSQPSANEADQPKPRQPETSHSNRDIAAQDEVLCDAADASRNPARAIAPTANTMAPSTDLPPPKLSPLAGRRDGDFADQIELSRAASSKFTNTDVPELDAPLGPAVPHELSTAPKNRDARAQELDSSFAKMNGDIFRLDRPSYANARTQLPGADLHVVPEQGQESELGDGSSLGFSDDGSAAQNDSAESSQGFETVYLPNSRSPTTRADETQKTRGVEERLRQARTRIFNPVWEVDNLQWPPVCLELLEQISHNVDKVAGNLMSACDEGLQILAITSPSSGEGVTTVACCLALLAGNHGLKVAIVDCDIENPTLSYQTNLEIDQDWRLALHEQLPLEEISVHSINDQVTLVPLLNPLTQQDLALANSQIGAMLQELSDSFDLVIVDLGSTQSSRHLLNKIGEQGVIQAAIAVVDRRQSNPDRIEDCLSRIRSAGIASVGLVENFAA